MTERETLIFMIKNRNRGGLATCGGVDCNECFFGGAVKKKSIKKTCRFSSTIDLNELYMQCYGVDSFVEEML